jgi:hypothetical protein
MLMSEGIGIFSTPTRERAKTHPSNHYGWMLAGEVLYECIERSYALLRDQLRVPESEFCFETFPHAVACKLSGEILRARQKCQSRRSILRKAGIALDALTNIDTVDAALCELTAHEVSSGQFKVYGQPATGLIVVPHPVERS